MKIYLPLKLSGLHSNGFTSKLSAIGFLLILTGLNNLFAQAPIISYASPQAYTVGTAITSLIPTNTGGAVTGAGQISTIAGNGNPGAVNGTGSAAEFSAPLGVAVDASNNVYVADNGNNLIRKISPAGVVTTFAGSGAAGSTDGTGTAASFSGPSGMAIDASGNLYVTDGNGIRKITSAGVVTTLTTSFGGASIAVDSSGNIFIGQGDTIYKVTSSGVASVYSGVFLLASIGVNPNITAITVDISGNVYVADSNGHVISKITPALAVITVAGSCGPGSFYQNCAPGLFNNPQGLAADALGNIYVADSGNNNIKVIDPSGNVNLFAGAYDGSAGFVDGSNGVFNYPVGLAVGPSNNLFVGDLNNNAIRKVTIGGYTISPLLPAGLAFDGPTGTISGTPTAAIPATNFTISAYNNFGIGTATLNITVNNTLPAISYPQSPITVTTGIAFTISPIFTGGAPNSYTFSSPLPAGISLDGTTGIISGIPTAASPSTNYNIIAHNSAGSDTTTVNITVKTPQPPKFSYAGPKTYAIGTTITPLSPSNTGGAVPTATMVSTFAGNGAFGAVNGPNLAASFSNPAGVALDAVGDVYVADYSDNLIRKIKAGVVSTFAGGFNGPGGLAVDALGNVFVADVNNNVVDKITPAGVLSVFSTGFGGNCRTCVQSFFQPSAVAIGAAFIVADYGNLQVDFLGPDGTVGGSVTDQCGSLHARGVAIDLAGNVYVADPVNNNIYSLSAQNTLAGPNCFGVTNGTGAADSFNGPTGVATDAQGNVYVADAGNNLVKKITPAGMVTVFAGSGAQGSADGVDTLATFYNPYGLAVDPFGVIYVADAGNNLIRKIVPGGYTISPALPAGLVFDSTTGTISGTPTALSPATIYTITAHNSGGSGTATVSIQIVSASSNANLTSLKLSSGTLSPAFAPDTTNYTATVFNAVTSITVTPTAADSSAVITVNGKAVASGSPSASIPLSVGPNIITTVVTIDSTSKTYTVAVTRKAADYAFLANLEISKGKLKPAFAFRTFDYTARVSRPTFEITVTPTAGNAFETIKVNDVAVTSGTASSPIALSDGINNITIVVTAQNGTNIKIYSLAVTKEPSAPGLSANNGANAEQSSADGINVHQGISPNGDGVNDILVIDGITAYPDNRLLIMNRNGSLVFETRGYNNSSRVFDGRSNKTGAMQLPGTYFYSLEYKDGNATKYKTGFIILKY